MKYNITKHLWVLLLIIQSTFLYAQSNSVSGTVIDELGDGMIGVTVVEKGTSNGKITDENGKFSLTVADLKSAVLKTTYSGTRPKK